MAAGAGAPGGVMVGVSPPGTAFRLIFGMAAAPSGLTSTFGAGGGSTSLVGSEAAIQSRRVRLMD